MLHKLKNNFRNILFYEQLFKKALLPGSSANTTHMNFKSLLHLQLHPH
jgi:hypothetical protein